MNKETNKNMPAVMAAASMLLVFLVASSAWAGEAASKTPDWGLLAMELLGGLAIFLFGMEQMGDALKLVAGDKMKAVLQRLSSNRFAGVATGTVATAVVQSSSVTTVIVVGFISAGLMTLPQALGVILGANIGTTVTAQIVAFKVTQYALWMVAAGFALFFLSSKQVLKQWGMLILGLGLVFFGMTVMGDAMKPLRSFQPFLDMMVNMETPLYGIVAAALFTGLIQSSSATTGIVIVLATEGLVSLEAGIALAMGANIGTCVTAALAAIGKPREAVRAATAHLLFNVTGVVLIFPFIPQFSAFIASLPTEAAVASAAVPRQIANAHTLFNVGMTLLFLPILTPFARLLKRIVPDAKEPTEAELEAGKQARHLDESLAKTPFAAIKVAREEIEHLSEVVGEMLGAVPAAIFERDEARMARLEKTETKARRIQAEIAHYLSGVTTQRLSEDTAADLLQVMTVATAIKSIAQSVRATVNRASEAEASLLMADTESMNLLRQYHAEVVRAFEHATEAFVEDDWALATETMMMKDTMSALEDELRIANIEHLQHSDSRTDMVAYVHQMEILEDLDRIYHHTLQIAQLVVARDEVAVDLAA